MINPYAYGEEVANRGSDLLAMLTPKQLGIELDMSYLRVVYGSRQWGKTTWTSVAHARAAIPGETSLAIAPTVTKAYDLLWQGFEWLNKTCNAGIEQRRGDRKFLMPNGAVVQCLGMATMREAEKIRGFHPPFASIEECGVYHPELLQFGLDDCLTPSQVKHFGAGGRGAALLGTPGRAMDDFWHEHCKGNLGASVHFATLFDNPHIPNPEAYLKWVLKQKAKLGWNESTPTFRREYRGEFCPDTEGMPYGGWDGAVLSNMEIPRGGMTIVSVDFGQVHHAAWVVGRIVPLVVRSYSGEDEVVGWRCHVVHASMEAGLTTDAVAARTNMLCQKWDASATGDPLGTGKQSIADMNKVYNTAIEEEDKRGSKLWRIWAGGSMLKTKKLVLHEDTKDLQHQIRTVPYNDKKTDHHERYPDHCLDAMLGLVGYINAWQEKQSVKPLDELSTEGMTLAAIARKLAAQKEAERSTEDRSVIWLPGRPANDVIRAAVAPGYGRRGALLLLTGS